MTYTKKVKIIEYFVVAVWSGYLYTSLFSLVYHLDINITTSEAKFWAFNLFIAIILWFPFIIIHQIIKNYSIHQILDNFKWHNLRKIRLFKIMITVGLSLLLIPSTLFIFSWFLIPSMNTDLIFLVDMSAFIGLVILIIGLCLTPKNKEMDNKQIPSTGLSPNAPESKPKDSWIQYAYLGFFLLNWIVLMPILTVIFRYVLSLSWFLIAIITVLWAWVTLFFLIYIERKK